MIMTCRNGIGALLAAILLFAACGGAAVAREGCEDDGSALPEFILRLEDGTAIPYAWELHEAPPILARAQSSLILEFPLDKPDSVVVTLTPFYSGGSAWGLEPISVEAKKMDASQYAFTLPHWGTYTPAIFFFLQYEMKACFGHDCRVYYCSIQLKSDH